MTADQPLGEALRGRADVYTAIGRVEAALGSPTARAGWLNHARGALGALHDSFDVHIRVTEAEDGLFADVLDVAPRLAHQIDVLRSEHGTITTAFADAMRID